MIDYPYSLPNTEELRRMILDNPDYPLVITVTEDTWTGEYSTEVIGDVGCYVTEMACYKNQWCDADELEEVIANDLADDPDREDLTDEEFELAVRAVMNRYPLQKVILVSL